MSMTKQQQQLVEDNMNLVPFTIRRYYPWHVDDEDIIQIGMIGLCQAAMAWDENKGTFSTYAICRIRGVLSHHFKKEKKRIPTISLDQVLVNDDDFTFHDFLVGKDNVEYVDYQCLYSKLTPAQQEIFDLKLQGLKNVEIARKFNLSTERIGQQVRIIRKKWDKYV